jgi:hypothetical protein
MEIHEELKKLREQIDKDEKMFITNGHKDLDMLYEHDRGLAVVFCFFLYHVLTTYSDKYNEIMPFVDNTWLKYGEGLIPAGHNVGQAVSYLKRYLSQGYEKSYQRDDLMKAAHFLLIETARRQHD